MIELNFKKIAEILNVDYQGQDCIIKGIATDSRQVNPGNLFVTWQGGHFDGHHFCKQAIDNGAMALIGNKPANLNVPELIVQDSIQALGKIVSYWRNQFTTSVVGVTGSNGKTTVKNMLASIMQAKAGEHYLAPKKSYNNNVGVPLTLSELNSHHQYAVIEMGMNHFGELSYLTSLVRPHVAVITNAGPGHLAGVGGTVDGVAKAKGEILEGLDEKGIAVLNADDHYFKFWSQLAAPHKVFSFGIEHKADVTAKNIEEDLQGSHFILLANGKETPIRLPLLGRHNVLNSLAAAAAALSVGIDLAAIKQGLETVKPEQHRLQFKTARNGAGLLDDCYNANPNSVRKAIDVLKQFPEKKILVLGDMRELGENEKDLHIEIGHYAKSAGIEHLFAVGDLMKYCVNSFGEGAQHFPDKTALYNHLESYLDSENIFLVKGSLSMRMAEVVEYLIKE